MKSAFKRLSNQTIAGLVIIFLGVSAFAVVMLHDGELEEQLTQYGQQHLDEYLSDMPGKETWQGVVTVATRREFGFIGERRALVHTFVRNTAPGAPEHEKFRGFEYHYKHDGSKWVLTGSASCTAKEHFGEGLKLFAEMDRATGGLINGPAKSTSPSAGEKTALNTAEVKS
ncbi:MAG: hypothetical protein IT366_11095 [Candidatus Hydrogenedentes bacterium]|nr:hypothetical protein [Candidatus Hydrogenedentota bacterium]